MMEERSGHGHRRRYVSRACLNCRLRKVKCTGNRPCERCESALETCEYVASRRGHRPHGSSSNGARSASIPSQSRTEPGVSPAQQKGHARSPDGEKASTQILRRDSQVRNGINGEEVQLLPRSGPKLNSEPSLVHEQVSHDIIPIDLSSLAREPLEQLFAELGKRVTTLEYEQMILNRRILANQSGTSNATDDGEVHDEEEAEVLGASVEIQNHTSLSETINVLEGTLGNPSQQETSPGNRKTPQPHVSFGDLEVASPHTEVTSRVEDNGRLCNVSSLRRAFDIYFTNLNPNLPFLNENEFRFHFESYLVTGGNLNTDLSKDIFVVLVHLIYAETMLLSSHWPTSSAIPGWVEFCFADRILNRLPWLSYGNLEMIQCLLIKVRFLATIQRIRSAYDTMCKAVQICFHIGLHNQTWWAQDMSGFERETRKRVFWSLLYLDRGISLNAGMPFLLREEDINVDLPERRDDTRMFPGRPLPEIGEGSGYSAYLKSLVTWAKLCSKAWDRMFSARAVKPVSEEVVMSLDAEILYSVCNLPAGLQWNPNALKENDGEGPLYMRRQMCLLHLHTNHLRLVMRHKTIVTLKCSRKMAEECVWMSKSSIDAVYDYLHCSFANETYRASSVMYLTAAIIPLICIIIQERQSPQREEVVESFIRAVQIFEDAAPGFALARLMLHRLGGAIKVARQVIRYQKKEKERERVEVVEMNETPGQVDFSQSLLELFREFDGPPMEYPSRERMDLYWTDKPEGWPVEFNGENMAVTDVGGHFDWSTSIPLV